MQLFLSIQWKSLGFWNSSLKGKKGRKFWTNTRVRKWWTGWIEVFFIHKGGAKPLFFKILTSPPALCLSTSTNADINNAVCKYLPCEGELMMPWMWIIATETSPEQHRQQQQQQQRSSEVHSKKTVLIKTIETRDGEVTTTWYNYWIGIIQWILQAI